MVLAGKRQPVRGKRVPESRQTPADKTTLNMISVILFSVVLGPKHGETVLYRGPRKVALVLQGHVSVGCGVYGAKNG